MGIPLVVAEPTGRYERRLRRFRWSKNGSCPEGGICDASVVIGEIGTDDEHIDWSESSGESRSPTSGDNWPHDDRRCPATRSPDRYARTVLRSHPRWRAMAEIDHPRLDKALASTSSLLENMAGGSSRWLAGTISVGEPPTGLVDPCIGPTTPLKGGEFQ
jgi:hypothetical protein